MLVMSGRHNQCFSCQALGHFARDCPKASSRYASRRSPQRQQSGLQDTVPMAQDRGSASQDSSRRRQRAASASAT
ncbi:hypothetical protein HA385_23665, partial [Escherichia coli]|nr:hypothetical protein [Escherichia coli]